MNSDQNIDDLRNRNEGSFLSPPFGLPQAAQIEDVSSV